MYVKMKLENVSVNPLVLHAGKTHSKPIASGLEPNMAPVLRAMDAVCSPSCSRPIEHPLVRNFSLGTS